MHHTRLLAICEKYMSITHLYTAISLFSHISRLKSNLPTFFAVSLRPIIVHLALTRFKPPLRIGQTVRSPLVISIPADNELFCRSPSEPFHTIRRRTIPLFQMKTGLSSYSCHLTFGDIILCNWLYSSLVRHDRTCLQKFGRYAMINI